MTLLLGHGDINEMNTFTSTCNTPAHYIEYIHVIVTQKIAQINPVSDQ